MTTSHHVQKSVLVFVDCEGHGPAPGERHDAERFELGAVCRPVPGGQILEHHLVGATQASFNAFIEWVDAIPAERKIFVSDNPAYDWQYPNYYFWQFNGRNPFGHSGRRIGDLYAGLVGRPWDTSGWKGLRRTPHDHHPVHDALGNLEAYESMLELHRGRQASVKGR